MSVGHCYVTRKWSLYVVVDIGQLQCCLTVMMTSLSLSLEWISLLMILPVVILHLREVGELMSFV